MSRTAENTVDPIELEGTRAVAVPTPRVPPSGLASDPIDYFSARWFSPMARPSYRIELTTVLFFSITLAAVDNAFISVFTKQTFSAVAPPRLLNFTVAIVGSASEIANILSFFWASLSNGVRKVPFINALQLAVIVSVGALAAVPTTTSGLLWLAGLVLAARICWSGIILLRPTVWRNNYRKDRAAIVGRFSSVQQVIIAAFGLGLAILLDHVPGVFGWAAPAAAGVGLLALAATSRLRVRREPALLRDELDPASRRRLGKPWQGPGIVWRILRRDRAYARFMMCMFILGFGNIMLPAMLVIVLRDQFEFGYFKSIGITSGIPYFLMPLAVPMWARLLDRAHVVHFRSIHSWSFASATTFYLAAVWFNSAWMLVPGSVMLAIGYGGGSIAWNLGHVDYSPPAETSQYMATHVTLNGIRGLLAPITSVAIYERLLAWGWTTSQAASAVLGISLVLCVAGGLGFIRLRRELAAGPPFKRATA